MRIRGKRCSVVNGRLRRRFCFGRSRRLCGLGVLMPGLGELFDGWIGKAGY